MRFWMCHKGLKNESKLQRQEVVGESSGNTVSGGEGCGLDGEIN